MVQQHVQGASVLTAMRNDQIRMLLTRLDELKKHRPDGCVVLLQHLVEAAVAFNHVATQPAG